MTTNEQFRNRTVIAAIDTHNDPDSTNATMAETGDTGAASAYAGTRSRSAGTAGGGGFDSLDVPSGPSAAPQKKGSGRLLGAEPGIFYGD